MNNMKKIILSTVLLFIMLNINAQKRIDIYYLTANAYCPSVDQIENETKVVLDSLFKAELADSSIVTHKINIMEPTNKEFVNKWNIYTNGLLFLYTKDGNTTKIDMNDFAFTNVPGDIPNYHKELAKQIKDLLK